MGLQTGRGWPIQHEPRDKRRKQYSYFSTDPRACAPPAGSPPRLDLERYLLGLGPAPLPGSMSVLLGFLSFLMDVFIFMVRLTIDLLCAILAIPPMVRATPSVATSAEHSVATSCDGFLRAVWPDLQACQKRCCIPTGLLTPLPLPRPPPSGLALAHGVLHSGAGRGTVRYLFLVTHWPL
jgi:hypothetical protein